MRFRTQAGRNFIDHRMDIGFLGIENSYNSQKINIKSSSTLVNMATATGTGTGTVTVASFIPASCIFLGITAYVKTILAGTSLTTWSLGITSHTDHFATTKALAVGTVVNIADYKTGDIAAPYFVTTAQDVLFTAAAGQFDTGEVRLTVHYISLTNCTG